MKELMFPSLSISEAMLGAPPDNTKPSRSSSSFEGQDAEILVLKEKFPYSKGTYEGLARTTKLSLIEVKESGPDVEVNVPAELTQYLANLWFLFP